MSKIRRRIEPDLLLAVVLSPVLVLLVAFTSGPPRVVLGLLFVLFLPGYALVSALYPKKTSLSGVERLALGLGLSFSVVALAGVLLNYTPLGIRLLPMVAFEAGFVVVAAAVAWYRRQAVLPEERFSAKLDLGFVAVALSWRGQTRLSRVLTLLVVASAVGALGMAAYLIAKPKAGERYTEFYILGSSGMTKDYPRTLVVGETAEVTVGIVDREFQPETYSVAITINGEKVKTVDGITLIQGQTWQQPVQWTHTREGDHQEVDFLLYKGTDAQPYRWLRLWVDVKGG